MMNGMNTTTIHTRAKRGPQPPKHTAHLRPVMRKEIDVQTLGELYYAIALRQVLKEEGNEEAALTVEQFKMLKAVRSSRPSIDI